MSYQMLGQVEVDGQATTTTKLLDLVAALGGRVDVIDTTAAPPAPPLPPERTEIARAFLDVLPFIPEEELDVFVHELRLWRRRYYSSDGS